jgi:hypothetical protein
MKDDTQITLTIVIGILMAIFLIGSCTVRSSRIEADQAIEMGKLGYQQESAVGQMAKVWVKK